ncbi:MAG: hypothetical protein K2M31_08450 [Muribaculaceae bacterium]|nr:hypothetical protein [Muribaculaceae bacterium]
MKNYAERFSMLEDLPVSEEILGAYLEGNLSPDEEIYLSELIESDPDLYMINDLSAEDNADFDFPEEEFELLELPDDSLFPTDQFENINDGNYRILHIDPVDEDYSHDDDYHGDIIDEGEHEITVWDTELDLNSGWEEGDDTFSDIAIDFDDDIEIDFSSSDMPDSTGTDWYPDDISFDA